MPTPRDDGDLAPARNCARLDHDQHVIVVKSRLHARPRDEVQRQPSHQIQHVANSRNRTVVDHSTTDRRGVVERSVLVDEDEIPYLETGCGDRHVVLVHGGAATRWDWLDIMAALGTRYRVVAPDLAGFGDSPRHDTVYSTAYLGRFLRSFMRAVAMPQATMVGHSLGGRVCLEVALRNPEAVDGLVLMAPLGFGRLSTLGSVLGTSIWLINRALGRRQPFPKLAVDLNEPDPTTFSGVRCATLLLWGTKDRYFPVAHSNRALRAIPNSRLSLFQGAGHAFHRSHSERFTSELTAFVDRRR